MAGSGGASGGTARHLENLLWTKTAEVGVSLSDHRVVALRAEINAAFDALDEKTKLEAGVLAKNYLEIDPTIFSDIRQRIATLGSQEVVG